MLVSLYLALSIGIGLVLILDGLLLLSNNGRYQGNTTSYVIVLIEFIWVGVSGYALLTHTFPSWSVLVPALYLLHNVLGWAYGVYLASTINDDNIKLTTFSLPTWYVRFGMTLGFVFSIASLFALLSINSA